MMQPAPHENAERLVHVEGGFLTPFRMRPGFASGCVHDADGLQVAQSQRFGGWRGDQFVSDDPERAELPSDAPHLPGRSLYLGHYMRHYGHFITETLSTFWVFERMEAATYDHFLFHRFVFGDQISGFARYFFEAFGIPVEKIRIIGDQGARAERIDVPARLLRLNHSFDPELRGAYARIRARAEAPTSAPRKLYISRRRLNLRARKRIIANEQAAEAEFRRRGFTTIYPETMPIAQQIGLYAGAEALAGPSGSGLHNSLFLPPGALCVELGDPRYRGEPAPTQALCDALARTRPLFLPFEGRVIGRDVVMLLDRGRLAAQLDATEAPELTPVSAPGAAPFADALRGAGERAFILGRAFARRVAGRQAA